jgi:mannitol/fructose-specific phosphotransferase system IIA component (Ntr-type)
MIAYYALLQQLTRANHDKVFEIFMAALNAYTPQEKNGLVNYESFSFFRWAAENGHLDVLNKLLELTPDPETRKRMIHAEGDYAFRKAARGGHLDVLNRLVELTPDPETRKRMIHARYHYIETFRYAARDGRLNVLNRLVELITDPDTREEMIHSWSDETFRLVAQSGRLNVLNRLLELTTDPDTRERMIHADNDEAFQLAAQSGRLNVLNRLLELTTDPDTRERMIHANNDFVFQYAAISGRLNILNMLLELTTDPEARERMIHAGNDFAFRYAAQNGHIKIVLTLIKYLKPQEIISFLPSKPDLLDPDVKYKDTTIGLYSYLKWLHNPQWRPLTEIESEINAKLCTYLERPQSSLESFHAAGRLLAFLEKTGYYKARQTASTAPIYTLFRKRDAGINMLSFIEEENGILPCDKRQVLTTNTTPQLGDNRQLFALNVLLNSSCEAGPERT